MRRGLSAAAVLLSVLALTAACGDDGGTSGTDTPGADGTSSPGGTSRPGGSATSSTEEPDAAQTIAITLEGDTGTPAGDRVDVDLGKPVDLVITADRPGEIHVHSSPEQYFDFVAGTNDPIELTFDRPGLVEIEFHEPIDAPIVELKVQ
ncbi:hypothetical protein [Nocardioides rubriscoriae]|uniref:hypothetical protein n=1 Tax=Nocardioides rubriscoriae TaxID=642762 RepID=UPI0011E04D76|nr:hypothetical protein [Nocardioides rubriscoriae]